MIDTLQMRDFVERRKARLFEIIGDLVRIPSENKPPEGSEQACQQHIAKFLENLGWRARLYTPHAIDGLRDHPLYWPDRSYELRPNLIATREGTRGSTGKSLLLSGHIDTVPFGTLPWTRSPFSGDISSGRLYGRGSNDMKGGVGISMFVLEALNELGFNFHDRLSFETVVDEEFGGCNGTLAGRLAGHNADAAIITEPSLLRICPAQRGGTTVHITLRSNPGGGVLTGGRFPTGVTDQLRCFLNALPEFAVRRRQVAPVHDLYKTCTDPVPVSITKISTGPWGMGEPINVPDACRMELYWQSMPGESPDEMVRQFNEWLNELILHHQSVFDPAPLLECPIRRLPGSALSREHPLVQTLENSATRILGRSVPVVGIEGPCDLFVFHEFGIPAVLWGPVGANTHAADEYLDLESAIDAAAVLLSFVVKWCGDPLKE